MGAQDFGKIFSIFIKNRENESPKKSRTPVDFFNGGKTDESLVYFDFQLISVPKSKKSKNGRDISLVFNLVSLPIFFK
jgi:hypothetical protein